MSTPTMNEIITEMARYSEDSGFRVDWSESTPWVAIHDNEEGQDRYFLEYEEACQFIEEAQEYAAEANVDLETAMLARAKQYIDCY